MVLLMDETMSSTETDPVDTTKDVVTDTSKDVPTDTAKEVATDSEIVKPAVEESISSVNSEMSTEPSSSPPPHDHVSPRPDAKSDISRSTKSETASLSPGFKADSTKSDEFYPLSMFGTPNSMSPLPRDESKGHPERKRRASDEDSCETLSKASETGTNEDSIMKDEDNDDDDEDEDKVPPGSNIDPERLKSFNMFCRLFVDENLDRVVPISKQPKDKVQAILDACDRQFPEFHERARKRIRTYLKSCRRMRRSKENGWEPLRPTPPHMTSAAAESYLAQACENESINAKRIRMGLEPLPASGMPITHHPSVLGPLSASTPVKNEPSPAQSSPPPPRSSSEHKEQSRDRDSSQSVHSSTTPTLSHVDRHTPTPNHVDRHTPTRSHVDRHTPTPSHVDRHTPVSAPKADFIPHPPSATFRPPPDFPPFLTNGNGLFRPGFPGYPHPAHHHPSVLHSPIQPASLQNGKDSRGPTDLSIKKQSSKNQLSSSEVTTIKQLISGYRESAAFLYRSADELEQLLLQQH